MKINKIFRGKNISFSQKPIECFHHEPNENQNEPTNQGMKLRLKWFPNFGISRETTR